MLEILFFGLSIGNLKVSSQTTEDVNSLNSINLKKIAANGHCVNPRAISVDKNAAYPAAFEECQANDVCGKTAKLRQSKYLNNIIEEDHRFVKRRIRHSQWMQTFRTAQWTIDGYESIHIQAIKQVLFFFD